MRCSLPFGTVAISVPGARSLWRPLVVAPSPFANTICMEKTVPVKLVIRMVLQNERAARLAISLATFVALWLHS